MNQLRLSLKANCLNKTECLFDGAFAVHNDTQSSAAFIAMVNGILMDVQTYKRSAPQV